MWSLFALVHAFCCSLCSTLGTDMLAAGHIIQQGQIAKDPYNIVKCLPGRYRSACQA